MARSLWTPPARLRISKYPTDLNLVNDARERTEKSSTSLRELVFEPGLRPRNPSADLSPSLSGRGKASQVRHQQAAQDFAFSAQRGETQPRIHPGISEINRFFTFCAAGTACSDPVYS